MADQLNFFFEQLVVESDMDTIQSNLETADLKLMLDQEYTGVISGFDVLEHAPTPDLTVDIAGPGSAYDQTGQRIHLPASVNLDVSVDSASSSTAVVTPGNEKYVSIYIQFERVASDLRFDGNGLPVNFRQDEGISFIVLQGAEATIGTATRPALLADALLIADVRLEEGDTQIFDAEIESRDVVTKPNSRFQFIFNLTSSSPVILREGPLTSAMQGLLDVLNGHISGTFPHAASLVTYDDTATAINLPANNVQEALEYVGINFVRQSGNPQVITAPTDFDVKIDFLKGLDIEVDINVSDELTGDGISLQTHLTQDSGNFDSDRYKFMTFVIRDDSSGTGASVILRNLSSATSYLVTYKILMVDDLDNTNMYNALKQVKVGYGSGFGSAVVIGSNQVINQQASGGTVMTASIGVDGGGDDINLTYVKATGEDMHMMVMLELMDIHFDG